MIHRPLAWTSGLLFGTTGALTCYHTKFAYASGIFAFNMVPFDRQQTGTLRQHD